MIAELDGYSSCNACRNQNLKKNGEKALKYTIIEHNLALNNTGSKKVQTPIFDAIKKANFSYELKWNLQAKGFLGASEYQEDLNQLPPVLFHVRLPSILGARSFLALCCELVRYRGSQLKVRTINSRQRDTELRILLRHLGMWQTPVTGAPLLQGDNRTRLPYVVKF